MCYKDEVQKRNEIKLKDKLNKENVPGFIQRYLLNIESKAGAINYWIAIRDFFIYLLENEIIKKKNISEITPDDLSLVDLIDVDEYLRFKEKTGMSLTTLYVRKNILKSFWSYLVGSNKFSAINNNVCKAAKFKGISHIENIYIKMPTEQQIQDMIEKIKWKKDDIVRERNLAVLDVLMGTGLRESELAGIDIGDIHLHGDHIKPYPYVEILGKGRYRQPERRRVFFNKQAIVAIQRWMDIREKIDNIEDKNALFINKNGRRLTEKNIQAIFKNYSGCITPHMIRHWYSTIMTAKYGPLFVRQQLGHHDISTTTNNYTDGTYAVLDSLLM